ncbi:MAG TPA: LacI family DNA-binding transcriptional regulator [Bryobacteraceae bacterium]|nr:LacI family DNA-binding transcriptional regulator [Bryobacteraceae bacterium]
MAHSKKESAGNGSAPVARRVSIRDLARDVNLSPTTVSLVLNDSPGAESIPQETKDRVFAAARRLNYRPNFLARSLRASRSYVVGVIAPELSDGYSALVLSGIEDYLLGQGYMYLVATHRGQDRLIEENPRLLLERHVEGLIAVNTPLHRSFPLPLVAVSGHDQVPGFTNIILNHDKAAELALRHLAALGHQRIAFFKGQDSIEDSSFRWDAIECAAQLIGLTIVPELCVQLPGRLPSRQTGYQAARILIDRGSPFTALFAFNDISAIGAIAAFRETGRAVPNELSVVGFDDVEGAAYHVPALTTIRQPLAKMGALAAENLLRRIREDDQADSVTCIEVDPELVVRGSTGPARS